MSLHYNIDTFQNIETFQPSDLDASRDDDSAHLTLIQDGPPHVTYDDRAKRLRNGARIISFDERSNAALCTQDGEWSVWLLDADGEPIRGNYFKSMRAAAFEYADHVMGCHTGIADTEPSEVEV